MINTAYNEKVNSSIDSTGSHRAPCTYRSKPLNNTMILLSKTPEGKIKELEIKRDTFQALYDTASRNNNNAIEHLRKLIKEGTLVEGGHTTMDFDAIVNQITESGKQMGMNLVRFNEANKLIEALRQASGRSWTA